MPTRFTTVFPPPDNDNEFEDIVCDVCKVEWEDPNTQRFGKVEKTVGSRCLWKPAQLR